MPTSESQKRANKKWQENNKEKYNAICAQSMKKRYTENKEFLSTYKKRLYLWKKESETLRNILL